MRQISQQTMEDETDLPIATTNEKILPAEYRQMRHSLSGAWSFIAQGIDRFERDPCRYRTGKTGPEQGSPYPKHRQMDRIPPVSIDETDLLPAST
jgi:hypothetical protein